MHINKLKNRNHTKTLINAEMTFDKVQIFKTKAMKALRIERPYLNIIKVIYKTTICIVYIQDYYTKCRKTGAFPQKSGKIQEPTSIYTTQSHKQCIRKKKPQEHK